MFAFVNHVMLVLSILLGGLAALVLVGGIAIGKIFRSKVLALVLVLAVLSGGSFYLYGKTRPHVVTTTSISLSGLEKGRAGIRSNGLQYATTTSIYAALQIAPFASPDNPVNRVSGALVHRSTSVSGVVTVYSVIRGTDAVSVEARIDHTAREVVIFLPEPTVDNSTVYISSVGNVSVKEGVANSLYDSVLGVLRSLLGKSVVSFDAGNAFNQSQAKALAQAKGKDSNIMKACGRPDIEAAIRPFAQRLYPGYHSSFSWPTSTPSGVNCSRVEHS
jgi:hypothetical protein